MLIYLQHGYDISRVRDRLITKLLEGTFFKFYVRELCGNACNPMHFITTVRILVFLFSLSIIIQPPRLSRPFGLD